MAADSTTLKTAGIIGAGAWGTALATVCARAGLETVLWCFEQETAEAITARRENKIFLPGVALDKAIAATTDLAKAAACDCVFMVTPAQHTRAMARQTLPFLKAHTPLVLCAKGIEDKSGALMSEVVHDVLGSRPLAILSGPTFALEVAQNKPTAVTLASEDEKMGGALVAALGTKNFRPYLSSDLIGAQIGGAVKNVIAIASGIIAGRNLGENARAALITRGLAEMVRLGMAKGAQMRSMMGLSGFGDLSLTCNSEKSRNMSLGAELGRGGRLADILSKRKTVAEGVYTAASLVKLARSLGVDMPIAEAVAGVLGGTLDVEGAIAQLISRPFKSETDGQWVGAKPAS